MSGMQNFPPINTDIVRVDRRKIFASGPREVLISERFSDPDKEVTYLLPRTFYRAMESAVSQSAETNCCCWSCVVLRIRGSCASLVQIVIKHIVFNIYFCAWM